VRLPILLLVLPTGLAAQAPIIDSIDVITHDIFDTAQARGNVLAGLMNALHVRTRPWVVRQELLFRAGEPLDARRLAETERNLRRLGIFRDASVDTVRVDGRLVAHVVTYDGWTTSLETALSFTGDVVTWSAGLNERNVLGTGHLVGGNYRKEVDRDAWRLRAQLNRLLGSRAFVAGFYDNLSDGYAAAWNAGLPFRSLSDRVELVLPGQVADRRVLRFRDGAASDTLWRRAVIQEAGVFWAPVAGPGGFLRLGVFGGARREEYVAIRDTALAIPDSVFGFAGASVEFFHPRFVEVTHYNGFAREEDVSLGSRLLVGFGLALPALGYPRGGVFPSLDAQTGFGTAKAFARLGVTVSGLVTSAGVDSGRVNVGLTLASRVIPRQATVLHVQGGVQKDPAPGTEFDLGHGLGPRAFEPHAFTGTRSIWGIAEHRMFLWDELFGLLGLGVAGFVDYGGAWFGDQDPRHGGDVGIGIRSGATSATGPNVGRLDLAYRFGDGITGSRWVVSFGTAYQF
jgi:hypothetical protein